MDNSILASRGIMIPNGGGSFAAEGGSDKLYTIELENNGDDAVDRIIALCPGDGYTKTELSTMLGVTVDAVIGDGEIISTVDAPVVCTGTPGKINSLLKRILRNPQRWLGMSVTVDNVNQLSSPFKVYTDDPLTGVTILREIKPSAYKSNSQQNDKLVHIPFNHFQFDYKTIIIVTLKANSTLTLDLKPGACFDSAEFLKNEAEKEFVAKGISVSYAKV